MLNISVRGGLIILLNFFVIQDSMVPPDNLMSPVAQVVHSKLQQMKWKFNNVSLTNEISILYS